eukprot:jgi/Hompol1/5369/HPOL_001195-RA
MQLYQSTPVAIDASGGFASNIPPAVLDGPRLKLVPLDPATTSEADWQTLHLMAAVEQDAYRLQPVGPFPDANSLKTQLEVFFRDPTWLPFILRSQATGEIVGMLYFLQINNVYKTIEIGIWIGARFHGQKVALEATYLMLCYAAECGYVRYEWKAHHLNTPSHLAAVSIGFTYEGTFRKHMFDKGMVRNTVWYSIIDDEWPAVKSKLEARISALPPLVRKDL